MTVARESLIENMRAAGAVVVTASARDVFPRLEAEIVSRGKSWKHVVRTWFYLRDILSWYDDFNRLRSDFFAAKGIEVYPASTGIGLTGDVPEVLAGVLLADEPWQPVVSPVQVNAADYGSRFSRAAEVNGKLYVSGTAALDGHAVAHVDDFAAQLAETIASVEAILTSRGRTWSSVTRLIAYCRDAETIPLATARLAALGLSPAVHPLVIRADVCRRAWLFEMEVDA